MADRLMGEPWRYSVSSGFALAHGCRICRHPTCGRASSKTPEMENYLQAGNAGAGRGFLYPPPFGDEGAASLGLALAGFDSTGGRVTPLSADHDSLLLGGCANLKTSEDFQASPPRKAVIHRLGSFLSPSSPLDLGDSSPQASPLKKSKMLGAPIQESVACLAS